MFAQQNKTNENMQTNIDEVEINGVQYVRKDAVAPQLDTEDAVIVRCVSAGCFFGYLEESDLAKGTATLSNARRLWYWSGAASLSQLAVDGTKNPSACKFPIAVPTIELAGVIEIIRCTKKSVQSLSEVAIWKA